MAFLLDCCCFGLSGEELYRDWDNHPAVQQYSFIKRLGEGGFSEVQLAQDKLTGKKVALKIIFLNRTGLTSEQRKILAGEAKLIRMVAHPNIIRCMQVLETRRQQVLVLEHLSGGEMLQQLQRVKRYTEAHACQLFRQVADAVAYMHSLSIMHRDIKPENCLLARPAQYYAAQNKPCKVKLIDLGMAGLYRPDKLLYGCMGSPGFIAPEVILGDAHTPALDIYSLGVLLFVMLVGRKPWDAQRSHTLQYAIQATAEAPGLADPVFLALSQPARELLLWMLLEEPGRRPTAAQVLGHKWMLQAAQGPGVGPAASTERLIQPAVQQRLRMLGNSRLVMGTARGMLLLHSRGSRSGAVAFHRAVKEARLKLQQQAAALEASGQLQQLQQQTPTAVEQLVSAATNPAAPVPAVGVAAPPDSTTAAAAASTAQTAQQGAGVEPPAAAPAGSSTTSRVAVAAAGDAGTKPRDALLEKQTVGQLARQSLARKSMLFDGKRPPVPPASSVPPAPAGSTAARVALGATSAAGGRAMAFQAQNTGGAAATAAGNLPVHVSSPDHALHCEALERGMSLPNPDFTPLTTSGYLPCSGRYRADRAVSVSPSALALLDADDRLCLLAAGTSADDGSDALFSWGARQGAADIVASFRHQYSMKPIIKSIARFGQSVSSSLSRSFRPSTLHSNSGRYMATAAAAAGELGPASVAGTQQCPGNVTAAARMLSISSDGDASDTNSLLAGHAVDSSSQLLHNSGSCAHSALASRADSNGVGCKSPWLPSRLSVGVAGQTAAGGAAESCNRDTAVGSDGVLQPSAAATHRGKPPLPATVKQQLTAAAAAAVSGRAAVGLGRPAGLSMQRSGSGGEDTLQGCASAISGIDDSALAGAHSAEHSIELAFLGTQFSMSPPALSPQTSAPGALATAESQGGNEQETVLGRNDIRGINNGSSSNPRMKHLQQQLQQLQQQQSRWQGHVNLAQPHVLPAIPSHTSLSASASPAASHDSLLAVVEDSASSACTAGSSIAHRQYGTGQAGSQQQKPPQQQQQQQQHLNRVTPFNNPSASAAAAGGIVVLADAVAAVPQHQKAPTCSSRGRDGSSSTAAASVTAGSTSIAAAGRHIRSVVNSPRMRAAATAAAAREEEEGLDLPNGLWLQQSQSVDSSFALSPAGPMVPALSAASALQSPLVGGDSSSLANVEFQLQQAAEEPSEAAQGDLGASVAAAVNSSIPHGSSSARARNAIDSIAAAAEADCTAAAAAEEARTASRHRRDPSVLDWMADANELQYAPDGGRDASVMHWLRQPPAAGVTVAADRQQQQQQGPDMFASLAWLNRTSSDEQGRAMISDPGVEGSGVATTIAASVVPRTRPFGSGVGGGHAIPMRVAAHRVAISCQRQSSSSNRQKRRAVPYSRRFSGRRSGSMNASSGGGGALALVDRTHGGDVFSTAAIGTQPGLRVAEAAAYSGGLRVVGVASSTEQQQDTIETGTSQASGELADFYVGSFTDRQGLAAAGEQLGRSVSIDLIGDFSAAAARLAGLATAADAGNDDLQMQASAADGDDSLLLGSVDVANQTNLCTCRVSIDGGSCGKAAAPPLPAAADAKGGSIRAGTPADTAAAGELAGTARSSDSSDSMRSSTGSLSKRSKHAAAIGQSKVAAAAAATVALYSEKQQYHQQQYTKQLQQQYSSATAVTNRRCAGGPAAVAMTGGAWYFNASERSSRSGSSSSSEDSNALEAAAAPGSAGVVSGVAAAPPRAAAAAAVATSSGNPAFDAVRHAGGVAWLVRGLSGKYHMPDEDIAAPAAAPAVGCADSRFRGLAAQQQQQPTFDDFDEPTAYYYAS